MKKFEIIEHTADIGIEAFGKDKREVFINVAKGMFEIIAGKNVNSKDDFSCKININAENLENLLIAWLNELLYLSEVMLVIFNKFKIEELSDSHIHGEIEGIKINPEVHKIKKEIKAVTYHNLEFKKDRKSGLWRARVIFDI